MRNPPRPRRTPPKHIGARLRARFDRFEIDAAVHHQIHVRPAQGAHAFAHLLNLGQRLAHEGLSAIARMHGHAEHFVDQRQRRLDGLGRRFRIERQTGPRAQIANAVEQLVHVAGGLDMHIQGMRAGLYEAFRVEVGPRQHQVHTERNLQTARGHGDHVRTEAQIRHEMTVHNVQVQRVRPGLLRASGAFLQLSVIGRQQRRQDSDLHHDGLL